MATLAVFYDASVLYPAELRSFLIHLAMTGLFRARWSDAVHEEWISNLLLNRPDLTREKLERTRRLRLSMKKPPKSAAEYLETLDRQGLTQTVSVLREYMR